MLSRGRTSMEACSTHPAVARASLSPLQRCILLTVLYADVFDYPLKHAELHRRMIGRSTDRAAFASHLAPLLGTYLSVTDGYLHWHGRAHLVPLRERREHLSRQLWRVALRYARWLQHVPFLRMVAVSGSLAVANVDEGSDVDFFCITEPNRLWVARLFVVPMSKLTRLLRRFLPHYLCPNYLVTLDALAVPDRNLFTAHEVAQAVPVWGHETFARFAAANRWVRDFLPHATSLSPVIPGPARRRPPVTVLIEWLLAGAMGDRIDRLAHRMFCWFYRRRAVRRGWPWQHLAPAYRRDRYAIPEGGYMNVVKRRLRDRVEECLGTAVPEDELHALFPQDADDGRSVYDWQGLFDRDYGPSARAAQP